MEKPPGSICVKGAVQETYAPCLLLIFLGCSAKNPPCLPQMSKPRGFGQDRPCSPSPTLCLGNEVLWTGKSQHQEEISGFQPEWACSAH